ncbi:MAG TPA: platelet-activating factor acetylhydrolase IB subunit, partial [Thermogutta sp.]|nr:platelet-activating factor acetylhydrolase IB subunit [Thermogutta sp.]
MGKRRIGFLGRLLVSTLLITAGHAILANDAVNPVPRSDQWWMQRHQSMNDQVKQGNVDLIFIGDSITHGWEGAGKEIWEAYYGHRNAVNLGIGGDRTQHVLWRLDNGNIDGIQPKLAVIMIGTNNAAPNQPEETAEGIKAIVQKLRERLPKTKILLLAIFPRGETPEDPLRQKNEQVNKIIAQFADGEMVKLVDIGPAFLTIDGILPKDIMPDLLHPNTRGYSIWAAAIEPYVAEVLGPLPPP